MIYEDTHLLLKTVHCPHASKEKCVSYEAKCASSQVCPLLYHTKRAPVHINLQKYGLVVVEKFMVSNVHKLNNFFQSVCEKLKKGLQSAKLNRELSLPQCFKLRSVHYNLRPMLAAVAISAIFK